MARFFVVIVTAWLVWVNVVHMLLLCCGLWYVVFGIGSLTVTQRPAYWAMPSGIRDIHYAPVRKIDFRGKQASLMKLASDSTPTQPETSASMVCDADAYPSFKDGAQSGFPVS